MSTYSRRTNAPAAKITPSGWLTAAERARPSRCRQTVTAAPLPAEAVPARSPRDVRWGQGPLLDTLTLQSAAEPRDLRRRRR